MRPNKYSYIVELDVDRCVLFNGLNHSFLLVPKRAIPSYEAILSNPQTYCCSHPNIISELVEIGLLVDDDCNEFEMLRTQRFEYVESKVYKTSIIPTFDCNYSCWYCRQNHQPIEDSEVRTDLILKHIKKYLLEHSITEYVLSWFGGEPLMQPRIIDAISSELKSFCKSHGIKFSGGITTNGALLSDDVAEMLIRNEINFFQIAIDGDRKSHNKNKFNNLNSSSFDLVLNNISKLVARYDSADVVLRLNYTPAMLKSDDLVNQICERIPKEIRRRITVDLQKIWQIDELNYDIELMNKLQAQFVEAGFKLSTEHVFSMCYVDKRHFNTIYYNGGVEKCDDRDMDNLRGFINEDGDIVWKEIPAFTKIDVLGDRSQCKDCRYYPLCYSSCPIARVSRISENGELFCGYAGDYSKLEHRIRDYCFRILNNQKLNTH